MAQSNQLRVFISYAHKDGAKLAQRLQEDLVTQFDVWLDIQRLTAGDIWSREIEDAIDSATVVVALLSAGSYLSDICRAEQHIPRTTLRYAIEHFSVEQRKRMLAGKFPKPQHRERRMKRVVIALITIASSLRVVPAVRRPHDEPVPSSCTPQVNQKLKRLLDSGQQADVYNVMACGSTTAPSRTQYSGPNGNHEILPLRVTFPDGSTALVEVVTNDALDGKVTARANAQVFAYGRAFFSNTHQYAAGIDDVHCSTSSRADNGWVVVNGKKYPNSC
jgi:TIR domain-containing protein